jgi:hypothetical protein
VQVGSLALDRQLQELIDGMDLGGGSHRVLFRRQAASA